MTIDFSCEHCQSLISAPDDRAGGKAKCPECRQPVIIPREPPLPVEVVETRGQAASTSEPEPLPLPHSLSCPLCGVAVSVVVKDCPSCGVRLGFDRHLRHLTRGYLDDFYFAGFWRRLIAFMIDSLALTLITGAIWGVVSTFQQLMVLPELPDNEWIELLVASFGLYPIFAAWLYYAFMESSSTQATLGKMALGLIVTDTDGDRIGFVRASARYFGKYLSYMVLGAGFLMAGLTERKQALHDIIAQCLVIRRNR